jgi:hypothetical protein
MAEKNPYNLAAKKPAGPPREVKGRIWTPEEQKEKLRDYIEMSRADWEKIKRNTHMRYYTKGEFRTGGFVLSNPFSYKPRDSPKEVAAFKLQNNINSKAPGYAVWTAPYESVDRVFVKMEPGTIALRDQLETILQDVSAGLNGNIRKLAEQIVALDKRVRALEGRHTKR